MRRSARGRFFERSLADFLDQVEYSMAAEDLAASRGFAQRIDPRVKLACCVALIATAVIVHKPAVIGALFAVAAGLALVSRIPLRTVLTRTWLAVLLFTGSIALPAVFLTDQGWISATRLLARAETTATFSLLLVFTTPWVRLLKSLRTFGLPVVFVVTLGMTYRYIFVLLRSSCDMFESRRSRLVGDLDARDRRRVAVNSAGVLLSKTFALSGDVYLAMQSRGYRGEVYLLDDFAMRRADWLVLLAGCAATAVAVWLGR